MNQRKIIFMGTPKIAATVLQSLLDANIAIELVVTQPDKKVGRKQILTYSAVKEVAMEHSIPTFQPRRIKDDYQAILDIQADLIITCASATCSFLPTSTPFMLREKQNTFACFSCSIRAVCSPIP